MSPATGKSVCVVIGVGPGNGAALVGKFAMAGYRVAMIARSRGTLDELELHSCLAVRGGRNRGKTFHA